MLRRPVVGHRPVALDRERELLVLGADAEFRLRLAARLEPRDEFVARFDRCHVDLVTSHAGVPAERARPYTRLARKGNDRAAIMAVPDGGQIRTKFCALTASRRPLNASLTLSQLFSFFMLPSQRWMLG